MKTKRIICITLAFLVVFGTSISVLSTLTDNFTLNPKINDEILNETNVTSNEDLKCASNGLKDLNYTSIYRNTTEPIRKSFESIRITVNTYGFADVNETKMLLWFNPEVPIEHNMTQVDSTTNFTNVYTPAYSDPIGFIRVTFAIYNSTGDPINTGTTATNFTIRANCLANMEVVEFYLLPAPNEQMLKADLVFDNSSNFEWKISIVDNNNVSLEQVLFVYGNNKFTINFYINTSFAPENKQYFIKVNLTEKTGSHRWDAQYFGFIVKVPLSILDENLIEINPTSVFRAELCTIFLNTTAKLYYLTPSNVTVTFTLKDTNSYVIINNQSFTNNNDGSFRTTFSVPYNRPAGTYAYTINTYYKGNKIEELVKTVLIKNNPPEIGGYEINDYGTEAHISIRYGEILEFTFDVSDIEDRLSYVTILLINEAGDEYEISKAYEVDLTIEVRTEDLVTGTWFVYVSVTDLDGATTELEDDFNDAPKEIEIIPDMITGILPWISLVIGIIIGIVSGIAMSYYLVKKQKLKFEPEEVKEKQKEKPLKTKKEKIVRPEQTEKEREKEEIEKVEPKKEEFRKEEPRKIRPPRKIKRKLR